MRLILILILGVVTTNAFGQGYIVLKDSQTLKYDKFKARKDNLLVDVAGKKEKQEIDINKVAGYYLTGEYILYYLKPDLDSSYSIDYQFIEKELSGNINLYRKTVSTYSKYGGSSNTYYYIEKSDRFENALTTNTIGQNKKRKIETLKSFVSDNPEILNSLGDDFKLNPENLISTIRKYNLAAYENRRHLQDTTVNTKLILYRRNKGKVNEELSVSINDNTLFIKPNDFLEIKISDHDITKICIGGENPFCELIEGSPHFKIYYELRVDSNSNYTLEKKTKKEADFYLKEINYYKERADRK